MSFNSVYDKACIMPRKGYLYKKLVEIFNNQDTYYKTLVYNFSLLFSNVFNNSSFNFVFGKLQNNQLEPFINGDIHALVNEDNEELHKVLELIVEKFH